MDLDRILKASQGRSASGGGMNIPEIQALLASNGIDTNGTRAALNARLGQLYTDLQKGPARKTQKADTLKADTQKAERAQRERQERLERQQAQKAEKAQRERQERLDRQQAQKAQKTQRAQKTQKAEPKQARGKGKLISENVGTDKKKIIHVYLEYPDGTRELHNPNGPAIKTKHRQEYYIHNLRHRVGGPAFVSDDGPITEAWYTEGRLDRADGPAVEYKGKRYYFRKGHLHREDGPAEESIDNPTGNYKWYKNGLESRVGGPSMVNKKTGIERMRYDGYDPLNMKDFADQIEYMNSLPPAHKAMIKLYTETYDQIINPKLSYGEEFTPLERTLVDTINYTIANAPPLKKDTVVYRGLTAQPKMDQTGFTSTSPNIDVARRFMLEECCLMKITLKAGSRVIPMVGADLTSVMGEEGEEEVLLGDGKWTPCGSVTVDETPAYCYTYNNQDFRASSDLDTDILSMIYVIENINPARWQAQAVTGIQDRLYVVFTTIKALYPNESPTWWNTEARKILSLMDEYDIAGPASSHSLKENEINMVISRIEG